MSDRTIHTQSYNEFGQVNAQNFVQGDLINVDANTIEIDMSQDLAQAASQIQNLLEQLQKQGKTIDIAQEQIANNIASQVRNNPTMREKLQKWGQSLGDATVSDVVKGAVKLAIRSAGVPLP